MDILGSLGQGFAVALTPQNLLFALIGVTLGTAIGVLPGIGCLPAFITVACTEARPRRSWSTHQVRRPPW
jgi:TctA family transporter